MCAWSKSISVTYISLADCRTIDLAPAVKTRVFKTLIAKIQEEHAVQHSKLFLKIERVK